MMGAVLAALASSARANAATPVDLELILLVDVSGSVDTNEFNLQRQGYRDAFYNSAVYNGIMAGGTYNQIAATLVYWSGAAQQQQAVGWTLISDEATSKAFGDAILAAARPYNGMTGLGEAMAYAYPLFASNAYDGTRLVIDVSGDGSDNAGSIAPEDARAAALLAGVTTINGLVIGTDSSVLAEYTNNVIGGTNPFVDQVNSFDDFGAAIQDKLAKEINPIPEPMTMLGLAMGVSGLVGYIRRRSR